MDLLIFFEVTTTQSAQFNLKNCPVLYSGQVKMSVLSKNSILCKSKKKIQGREGNSWERLLCPPPLPGLLAHNRESRQKEKSPFSAQTFSPQSQTSLLAAIVFEINMINTYQYINEKSIGLSSTANLAWSFSAS